MAFYASLLHKYSKEFSVSLHARVDDKLIKDIRLAVSRGLALGGERFSDEIATEQPTGTVGGDGAAQFRM